MTQFQIKVRAEDAGPDDYKTSYLQIFRKSDDVSLKEAILTYNFQDGSPIGQPEPINILGKFVEGSASGFDDETDEYMENNKYGVDGGVYQFIVSAKIDPFNLEDLVNLMVGDGSKGHATVTAVANKLAAQVQFVEYDDNEDGILYGDDISNVEWHQQSVDKQTITNDSVYIVTVTSSDNSNMIHYAFEFVVVDLELDTLDIDGESLLNSYYVENIDGEDRVVYYAIVDEHARYVEMEIQTHNNHTKYDPDDEDEQRKASTLTVSDLDSTVRDPMIADGSRDYRQTQKLSDGERSQFQIKVGNYLTPGDKNTQHLVNTKYLRLYRSSSETRMQEVIVYYQDKDTGEIIAVPAIYDDSIKQYSAFVPDYVELTDIELIGPGDLSYLKLTPGMDEPHRKEYIVRDAVLIGEETPFDLWVKAVDGTEGMYKVVIYKEDNTLLKVLVDDKDAVKRDEPYIRDWKDETSEHTLYDALADGHITAKVYAEATSRKALLNLGLAKDGVAMPTSATASLYNYWMRDPAMSITTQDYMNPYGVAATEVAIQLKPNPGLTYTDATYYLHIYQKDSNAQMAEFTMEYVDDLGKEGTAVVYRNLATNEYTVVLPSTAVDATLTGISKHPMASIVADLAGEARPETKYGIYDMKLDPVEMGHTAKDAHFTVTSTDGTAKQTYTVHIQFADLSIRDLTVTDHYDPADAGGITVNHPSMSYQVIAEELTRYYEALVGDALDGHYNGNIDIDYDILANNGYAKVTAQVDNGAIQPPLPANTLQISNVMAVNKDLQSVKVVVRNTVNVEAFDGNSVTIQPVTYEAEYLLNVYRYSSNTDIIEVKFDYKDGGKNDVQYGIFEQLKDKGDNVTGYDDSSFVLYLPTDVNLGDLTITTASAGAQIAVSTKPFTQGAVSGVKFNRNQVKLKDVGVAEGDTFYVYVLSSNNRESKIYTVNVETVNLDLREGTVSAYSLSDKNNEGWSVDMGFLLDLERRGTATDDTTDADAMNPPLVSDTLPLPDGYKYHEHVDGKTVTVYEVHVPNYEIDGEGSAKRYLDTIEAELDLLTKGLDVNLDVSIHPTYAVGNSIELNTWWGQDVWNITMDGNTTDAFAIIRVAVTGATYGADGSSDAYEGNLNVHHSNMLERVFYIKLLRMDTDTSLADFAKYYWAEADVDVNGEHSRDFTHQVDNPMYVNYIPEANGQFRVEVSANSDSAKVDVRVIPNTFGYVYGDPSLTDPLTGNAYEPFDNSGIQFTRHHSQYFNDTLQVPVDEFGNLATHFQVVVTVLAGAQDEHGDYVKVSYVYNMERVVKSLEKAGATDGGDANLSNVVEYLMMEEYIDNYNNAPGAVNAPARTPDASKGEVGQRVIVAVEDPAKLELGTVDVTAIAQSGHDILALGTLKEDLINDENAFSSDNRWQGELNLISGQDTYTDGAGTHHSLYAKAVIKGVERDITVKPEAAYNTEYIKFVEWDDNAELESVELQYTLGGFEYTANAYQIANATIPGYDGEYVVYLPNVVESLHDLISTAKSLYANVKMTMLDGTDATAYRRHVVNYVDEQGRPIDSEHPELGKVLDLDSVNETVLTITVQPSVHYYDASYAKTYVLRIVPVDLVVDKAEFNEKVTEVDQGHIYNLAPIPYVTVDKVNTFEGKVQATVTDNELLATHLKSKPIDETEQTPAGQYGDMVMYGYIKHPVEPAVSKDSDVNGLWHIYNDLMAEYNSVSKNYDETYTGITWVDYTAEEFSTYANYQAYLAAGGKVNDHSLGLTYTGWIAVEGGDQTLVNEKHLSASEKEVADGVKSALNLVDISPESDATTMVKVHAGKELIDKDGVSHVQSFTTYNVIVTRQNETANQLELYALAQGDSTPAPAQPTVNNYKTTMEHMVDPAPVTSEDGVTTNYSYLYAITTETDDLFDLWLDQKVVGHEAEEVTIEVFQQGDPVAKITRVTNNKTGADAKNEVKLNANNRLDIGTAITDKWNTDPTLPNALQVVVTAVAESGAKNIHTINVYRKSSEAKLDMLEYEVVDEETHTTQPDEATNLHGNLSTNRFPPEPTPTKDFLGRDVYTYGFTISTNEIVRGIDGTYYVESELFSVKNVLGNRAAIITVPDKTEYVGQTTDADGHKILLPIGGYKDGLTSGTIDIIVTAEDGSDTNVYHFTLDIISGDTAIKIVTTSDNNKSGMEGFPAFVKDDTTGQVSELTRDWATVKQELIDIGAEKAVVAAQIALEAENSAAWIELSKRMAELERMEDAREEEIRFYFQVAEDEDGNTYFVDKDNNKINAYNEDESLNVSALDADGVRIERTVWYGFLTQAGVLALENNIDASTYLEAVSELSAVGVNLPLEDGVATEAVNWPYRSTLYKRSDNFSPVHLFDELANRPDEIIDFYDIAFQSDRAYPNFPMEQAVDNVYFSVKAQDGSIRHYVLQVRNANTENLNLDYVSYQTDEGTNRAYGLWAYAQGIAGVAEGTAAPNALPTYRTVDGGVTYATTDGDGVVLKRFQQVVDKYGTIYRDQTLKTADTAANGGAERTDVIYANLIVPETYAVAQEVVGGTSGTQKNLHYPEAVWGSADSVPANAWQDPDVATEKVGSVDKYLVPAVQKVRIGVDADGNDLFEYRLVPTTFNATVDRGATNINIRAVAEYPYSGVMVVHGSGGTYTQGEQLVTINVNVGSDTTVYIYVRSQEDDLMGSRSSNARRYTLNLHRANDNRALEQVTVEPDEATLNDRQNLLDAKNRDEVNRTRIVEGDVAAASEQVALTITPSESSAWVSLYELDEFGNFKSEPMEFYVPTGLDESGNEISGAYEYDEATETYYQVAEGQIGHFRRIKQVRGSMGSSYVRVSMDDDTELKGSYTRTAVGTSYTYTYVGKGNGPFERYDITVDFPMVDYVYVGTDSEGNGQGKYALNDDGEYVEATEDNGLVGVYNQIYNESVAYGIQVANLANGADLTPARYTLILNHRDNDLRLSSITANKRRAKYVSADGATLKLDEKTGKLVVTGQVVEDRKAATQALIDERAERIGKGELLPEQEEFNRPYDILTTLEPELYSHGMSGGMVADIQGHSVGGDDTGAPRDGILYLYKLLQGTTGTKGEY
ncbi:MAG: cadherin-like beta sandwich domain-containing protein, partial [Muribaculaceae bacterium]|nr:cadherin-like beta sandwich domain-containing protein [Muribaculaceae bacterium]